MLLVPGIIVDQRTQDTSFYYSEGTSDSLKAKWAPEDPAKVQLVACMDKVSTGAKIRDCKFDTPKPDTVALLQANWHLRVFEVATGRLLLDKSLAGDDRACPTVALIGPDKQIAAEVSDKATVALLRDFVNK